LFYRHSRGVTLTAAGRRLLPYPTRVQRLWQDARRAAAAVLALALGIDFVAAVLAYSGRRSRRW
jgi:DNA-binding transcriptional LysR family regulator